MKIKYLLIVFVLVVVLAAGLFYYFGYGRLMSLINPKREEVRQEQALVDKQTFLQETIDSSVTPSLLPKDLPFYGSSKVTQNYNAITKDNQRESGVRVYETDKSIDEIYKVYKKYLQDKKIALIADLVDSETALLSGRMGDVVLTVDASNNQHTKKRMVQISAIKDQVISK